MKRLHCAIGLLAIAAALTGSGFAVAVTVTPSGSSDALAHRVWYPGGNSYWVDNESSASLAAYWDPSGWYITDRWWDVPVLEFPMAGVSSGPTTLNFYVSAAGSGPMVVRYAGGDDNGVVEAADWLNIGNDVGAFDVTSQIQQSLDADHAWAVFTIRPNDWFAGTTIAASESGAHSPFIENVPEPSVLALLVTAAFGLPVLFRRRRKHAT